MLYVDKDSAIKVTTNDMLKCSDSKCTTSITVEKNKLLSSGYYAFKVNDTTGTSTVLTVRATQSNAKIKFMINDGKNTGTSKDYETLYIDNKKPLADEWFFYNVAVWLCVLHLAENLEVRYSVDYRHTIDGIVDFVVLVAIGELYCLIVLGEGLDKGACRRDDDLVLAVGTRYEEHAVVVVVLLSAGCEALHETELGGELVGCIGPEGVNIHRG